MISPCLRSTRIRAGFTLVELLVVIAVIAVLAGLSLAGLASARNGARRTVCTSNLRQIGQALRMYIDDFNDRPPRLQELWESGRVKTQELLLCPNDWSGNWGGILYDNERRGDTPHIPPETIRHSYIYPYATDPKRWKRLVEIEGGNAGVAICQLHGRNIGDRPSRTGFAPSILDYEGLVLRLQLDGAVVQKHVLWRRISEPGGSAIIANLWRLLSESPEPGGL